MLRADDSNGGITEQAFTITVSDNTDPSFTSATAVNFAENGTGTAYTVTATDANQVTYSLGTGNDEALFDINGGLVTFKSAPDFETPGGNNSDNTYVINVIATDASNNTANQNVTITVTDVDEIAPIISQDIRPDLNPNANQVDITFSKGVFGGTGTGPVEASDFSLLLSNNTAVNTPVITSITNNAGQALVGGETVLRVNFGYTGTAEGDESLTFTPVQGAIFDAAGNAASTQQTHGTLELHDNTFPTITGITLAEASGTHNINLTYYIDVDFSEAVNGVTFEDFALSFSSSQTGLTHTVTTIAGTALTGVETTVRLNLTFDTGEAEGNTINMMVANNTIFDRANNPVGATDLTTTLKIDQVIPGIGFMQLDANNSVLTTFFTEKVFGDGNASLPLQTDDLSISVSGGTATGATITSLTNGGGGALVGGEEQVLVNFTLTGTPNGNESVILDATSVTSIFDEAGYNQDTPQGDNVNKVSLNDIYAPAFTSLTTETFAENGTGTAYTVAATDANAVTYSLGTGNDEGLFNIANGLVTFKSAPDFENPGGNNTDNTYVINVIATDASNNAVNRNVTITVTNVDDTAPVFTSLTTASFAENGTGTVYTVAATDANAVTYSFGNGNDEAQFDINGGVVTFKSAPDFEAPGDGDTNNTYVVNVIATDAGNNAANQNVTITVTNVDDTAPVFTSLTTASFAENGTGTVYTVAATDANAVTYSFGNGNDEALFDINGGVVTFKSAPDFEAPEGNNSDNTYVINVIATDAGNNAVNQNVTITVTNVNDNDPVFTSQPIIAVNGGEEYVYQYKATDGDGDDLTFSAPTIPTWLSLEASGSGGQVTTFVGNGTAADTDGTGTSASFDQPEAMAVDSNDNLHVYTFEKISKVSPAGVKTDFASVERNVTKIDFDSNDNLYVFTSSKIYKIDQSGNITFYAAPQFPGQPAAEVSFGRDMIQNFAMDAGNGILYIISSGSIKSVDLSDGSIGTTSFNTNGMNVEDMIIDSQGNLIFTYIEATFYNVGRSTPQGSFTQLFNTNSTNKVSDVVVDANGDIIFIDQTAHLIKKHNATDGITTLAGGAGQSLIDGEGTAAGFNQPDEIVLDSNGNAFVSDALNHAVRKLSLGGGRGLNGIAPLAQGDHNVVLRADDGHGGVTDQSFTITVNDITDPVFTSGTAETFAENGTGTAYTVAATDANAVTYSLGTGNDEALFDINGGLVTFKTTPDFEAPNDGDNNNTYVIDVKANDGVNTAMQLVTITVTNVDDTDPVFISATAVNFAENGTGTAYTVAATDANSVTYSLGTGHDEGLFNIANGLVTFKSAPDFETPGGNNTDNTYVINVIATDASNNTANQNVTITVTDIDDTAPVFTSLTTASFVENGTGTAYTIAATDANAVTYALGTGNDEALFNINGGEVTFKSAPDFETPEGNNTNNTYVINVIATDAVNNAANQNVTITVTDVDEIAPSVVLTASTNAPVGGAYEVTAQFSEDVTGFELADITVTGGTPGSFATVDANTYTFFVTSGGGGADVSVAASLAHDLAGNANVGSNILSLVFTVTPPAKPIITHISDDTGASNTDGITSDRNLTVSGTSDPNAVINLFANGQNVNSSTADANGNWTVDASHVTLPAITFSFLATASDGAGNTSENSDAFSVSIDFTAPAKPVITHISDDTGSSSTDGVTSDRNLTVSGTSEPNAVINLFANGQNVNSAQADGSGNWTVDASHVTLPAITFGFVARASDVAGNMSGDSDPFSVSIDFTAPAKPVITHISDDIGSSSNDGITSDRNLTVSGTSEPNALINLFANGQNVNSAQADGSGNWTLDASHVTLPAITFGFVARASDVAGNMSGDSDPFSVSIDFTAPAKPVITHISDDTGSSSTDGVTSDRNILINGTAEAGVSVDVFSQAGKIGTVEADANGDWMLDISGFNLPEFTQNMTAEAIDLAGNRSAVSDIFTITIDFTAPVKPIITHISDDTGSSSTDGITSDRNLMVSGTSEPNALINFYAGGTNVTSALANGNGDWTIDVSHLTLPTITFGMTVTATDVAGNVSDVSDPYIATIDFTGPTVALSAPSGPTEGSFVVTAQFNEDVTGLTLGDITVATGTASNLVTVDARTYTFSVSSGNNAADVTIAASLVTDIAGNANIGSNQMNLDFTAPAPVGVLENSLVDFIKSEEISVYPNPAKDILNIDLSELSVEKVDITLINASGLAVFERNDFTGKTLRLNVSGYTSGLYIVQFYDGITIIRKKVMVRK
ncbi:MAG: T9SS type A sorting domain-containing protein [Roseivirga sp.]|nr:T9SS type A sorting domain-containing protein [Roseivirga sp.]